METKHINCELVSSTCQQACLQKPKQPSLLNCWSCDQINTRKFIPNTPETRDNKHGVQTGTAAACSLLCRFISSHISIANAKITGPVKLDWILWNLITPTYTQASWWRLKKMKEKKFNQTGEIVALSDSTSIYFYCVQTFKRNGAGTVVWLRKSSSWVIRARKPHFYTPIKTFINLIIPATGLITWSAFFTGECACANRCLINVCVGGWGVRWSWKCKPEPL